MLATVANFGNNKSLFLFFWFEIFFDIFRFSGESGEKEIWIHLYWVDLCAGKEQ